MPFLKTTISNRYTRKHTADSEIWEEQDVMDRSTARHWFLHIAPPAHQVKREGSSTSVIPHALLSFWAAAKGLTSKPRFWAWAKN